MVFPESYEIKIGFDRLRQMLSGLCLGDIGRHYASRMKVETTFHTLERQLKQVNEFKHILESGDEFPISDYHDMRDELNRLMLSGTYIDTDSLAKLHSSLLIIFHCRAFLEQRAEKFPFLLKLGKFVETDRLLINEIRKIIDDDGNIRDKASAELQAIRNQINRQKLMIDKSLARVLSESKRAAYSPPDAEISIRGGRWVLPVYAQHKRHVKGIIHDESHTGQTVFIEPEQVFEESNYLIELQYAERREIIKILTRFSEKLRPDIPGLMSSYRFLGLIDFIRAKAKLASEMGAVMPSIEDYPVIDWKDAVHPLLLFSHRKQNKFVIPNNIHLDSTDRIMVISGPNAGGKSVCLKTTGLLQYMLQCGLLIPVREDSKAGIFRKFFIDIGDEQSIDNDLSTYSSHLLNIRNLLQTSDDHTLFLIDEFGAGTEPQTGGAIAESVLEALVKTGATGVITTHYANLKLLAARQAGLINAAMMYDTKNMQPLFRLRTGKPGSSFAFEIAAANGIDENILKRAAELAGKTQIDYDRELMQLDLEMENLKKRETGFKLADDFLNEVIAKYQKLHNELENRKQDILNEAKSKAKEILDRSNKLIENTIKEIKEAEAEKSKTKKIREEFVEKREELLKPINIAKPTLPPPPPASKKEKNEVITTAPIKAGERVKVAGYSMMGEVLEIKNEEAVISFNSFTLKTSSNKLIRADEQAIQFSNPAKTSKASLSIHQKMALFQSTLDVRGKRVDEAVSMLKSYLDEALLLEISQVRILHGTGSGVLRRVLRDEMKLIPEVISVRDENVELGGSGISVVKLRD